MGAEQFDLFLILLKLKSYLVSLVEHSADNAETFDYTEEFLDRKYPEQKSEIMDLLHAHEIHGDAEIAFDEKIHFKFREMVKEKDNSFNLTSILEKFRINSIEDSIKERTLNEIKSNREEKLKEIVALLLQLARIWTQRSELENNVEDFSFLEEEELIRPDEQKELGKLDHDTMASFNAIAKLSHIYLEHLIEYYFTFGGDLALTEFVKGLNDFKTFTEKKYKELFKKSGLDQK